MDQRDAMKQLIEDQLPPDLKNMADIGSKLDHVLEIMESNAGSNERAMLGRGVMKNLNDNPMFLTWLARTMASLSDRPLEKMIVNLILGAVIGRDTHAKKSLEEKGHAGPLTIVINPTMRCNLRCIGCYSYNYKKTMDMEYSTLAKVLCEAREMGIRFITVSGGEPFLYPDLFRMCEEFSDLMFMSYTNSTLIDEAMAERIAETGNLMPAISVEGYENETDRRRGPGIHNSVLSAMKNLRKAGVFFGFSATPTSLNSEIMCSDDFVDYYMDQGALFAWYFNYIPVGRKPDLSLMPTPAQRDMIREATLRWQKTRPIFIGDFWNNGPCVGGCLSASRYCYITVDGYVQPCTFVHFYKHKVPENSLQEIFDSEFFQSIRDMQPYHSNLLRPCKVIDHPQDMRKVMTENEAKPSYEGAEQIIRNPEVVEFLDNYSREYGEMADRAWEGPDYLSGQSILAQFLGRINVEKFFNDRMKNAEQVTSRKEEALPRSRKKSEVA